MKINNEDSRMGARFRACRLSAGYDNPADFAADLGVDAAAYIEMERGAGTVNPALIASIAKLSKKSVHWIITGSTTVSDD